MKNGNQIFYTSKHTFQKFQNFICLPASLPAVRPTSGMRIGPGFSHNTKYQCANSDLLFQLTLRIVSPFIFPCLPFPLTGEQKGKKKCK